MTRSVYVESSVISYLAARPSRDVVVSARQAITANWWQCSRPAFDVYISALVELEIASGDGSAAALRLAAVQDVPSVAVSAQAELIAAALLEHGAVPVNSPEDALHIGIAAAQGADYLLTWNFKHINNAQTRERISSVIEALGFACPVLCSPEELEAEDD